jgi:hypothetical protein
MGRLTLVWAVSAPNLTVAPVGFDLYADRRECAGPSVRLSRCRV